MIWPKRISSLLNIDKTCYKIFMSNKQLPVNIPQFITNINIIKRQLSSKFLGITDHNFYSSHIQGIQSKLNKLESFTKSDIASHVELEGKCIKSWCTPLNSYNMVWV